MCPASDFAFVQDGGAIGEQTRRMDSPSSTSEPRVAGVTDLPRSRPGAKVTDEQFINDSARRPRGRLAEEGYGGPAGAPPGHEEVFNAGPAMRVYSDDELRALHQRAGFEQFTVQTDQRLQLALARKGQP